MKFLSLTSIFIYLFLGYIIYSTYMLYTFLYPSECKTKINTKTAKNIDEHSSPCLNPAFKPDDVFQLFLCTSIDDHPLGKKLDCFYHNSSFKLAYPLNLNFDIDIPFETANNGSLFIHGILTKLTSSRHVTPSVIHSKHTVLTVTFLTKYLQPTETVFNLLKSDKNKSQDERKQSMHPVTHWKTKIVMNGLETPFALHRSALPYEILHLIQLDSKHQYMPIIHFSDARQLLQDVKPFPKKKYPLKMPLEFVYEPLSMGRLRLTVIIEKAFLLMKKMGFGEREIEDAKGIFFGTKPYFLLLTTLIISFHALFDFLAFKNDIQFWRRRETMEGLSFHSILCRFISQFIITLYLWDRDSSLLITVPSGIATCIELWKMKKLTHIEFKGFRLVRKAGYKPTVMETKTAELDSETLRTVNYYILPPLLISGAIYSILYVEHKSLYSWAIESAVNGVYCFGFIAMLPQLFINYKLKSVAHLPWRAFMYKAFNTFIDDFFAFLIPSVPTSHRLATFRDDIVFLIYLYQRWLYPIDRTRLIEAKFVDQSLDEKENVDQANTLKEKKNE